MFMYLVCHNVYYQFVLLFFCLCRVTCPQVLWSVLQVSQANPTLKALSPLPMVIRWVLFLRQEQLTHRRQVLTLRHLGLTQPSPELTQPSLGLTRPSLELTRASLAYQPGRCLTLGHQRAIQVNRGHQEVCLCYRHLTKNYLTIVFSPRLIN